ncbi:MAG: hypothetical protein ACXWUU_13525 [Burkholderiales bacterium]
MAAFSWINGEPGAFCCGSRLQVGAVWDLLCAWAAFACVSLWSAGILASAVYGTGSADAMPRRHPFHAKPWARAALIPQWQAHRDA